MAKRKLLFLEDLYNFCVNGNENIHFFAEKGQPIVVQVNGNLQFEEDGKNTEGLLPVHLQSCHIDTNINRSNISEEVMNNALPSFKNRPILGYIHEVDGELEFGGHNMHRDENGEIVYDEVPVGIIPESCNIELVYDDEKGKKYVNVDGFIYETYSKAADILRREEECPVSVELCIREYVYNAKEKYLDILDFYFSGVTILGKTSDGRDINPGMSGANIKLADFCTEPLDTLSQYEKALFELQDKVLKLENACFNNANQSKKGGIEMTFEELLTKYEITAEDVTFEYEGMSCEDLEAKFEEVFGKEAVAHENFVKSFELSHEDIRCALYQLLSPVEHADDTYYWITNVYDTYFVYESWCGDDVYGQAYTVDGEDVAFDGERYVLYKELLTEEEHAELEKMRGNYAQLVEFKETAEKNELHAQREAVVNSEQYSVLTEVEAYKHLVEHMDEYSLSDLEKEVKIIFADYITNGGTFSVVEEVETKPMNKIGLSLKKDERSPYGNIFKRKKQGE